MEILCFVNEIIETMFFTLVVQPVNGIIVDTIRPLLTIIIVDLYIP